VVRQDVEVRPTRAEEAVVRTRRILSVLTLLLLASCSQAVRYTDELVDSRTGRTIFVRTPATFGGVVGFIAGIPVDIAALPITYPVYKTRDEGTVDPLSVFLFPSFVLWRAGVLVGAPFDVLEYLAYRMWLPEDTLNAEERNRLELELDAEAFPFHRVEWVYPRQ